MGCLHHFLKYAHCFAIVDESCTLLRMLFVRHSFLARGRAELLKWSGEGTGPTLTSLLLAESLQAEPRVVRIDPSNGANTSSARTRGGGRSAGLKVLPRTPEDRANNPHQSLRFILLCLADLSS